jgi:hypothetical protein
VVRVVDFGRASAITPARSPAFGDLGAALASRFHRVVTAASEVQLVRIGSAAAGPRRCMVNDRQLDRRRAMRDIRALFAGLGDLRSELTMLGRYIFSVLDEESQLL